MNYCVALIGINFHINLFQKPIENDDYIFKIISLLTAFPQSLL